MNETQIQVFKNEEFGEIRTVVIDGEPWFVGRDVCSVFGDKNHIRSLARVDEADKKKVELTDTLNRKQIATVINESGLYALLFAMQPQKAHNDGVSDEYPIEVQERITKLRKFKRWVTAEVLPSIRKTGTYSIQAKPDSYMIEDPIERAKRWIEEKEDYLKLENKIKEDEPKVAFADKVADASNLIDIGQMTKLLNDQNIPIGRNRLFEWLRKEKYLRDNNEPYQKYIDNGIFKIKELTYTTPYGQQVSTKTYVTGKGQIFIAETLRKQFVKKTVCSVI